MLQPIISEFDGSGKQIRGLVIVSTVGVEFGANVPNRHLNELLNHPIQGTNATIIKRAIALLDSALLVESSPD